MSVRTVTAAFAALVALSAAAAPPPSADALVQRIDAVRLPDGPNLLVALKLQANTSRRAEPAYSYTLRMRRGTGSLVEAIDGDQRGQKYLTTPAGYWLFAPRTRQALRLTPLQLVRGQASIGDISRMRFSADYDARFQSPAPQTVSGAACWVLELTATSPFATYARIVLYAAQADGRPVKADLFSAAGKRLKSVEFGPVATVSGRRLVQTTTFIDGIDAGKNTVMTLNKVDATETPAIQFKPQALSMGR